MLYKILDQLVFPWTATSGTSRTTSNQVPDGQQRQVQVGPEGVQWAVILLCFQGAFWIGCQGVGYKQRPRKCLSDQVRLIPWLVQRPITPCLQEAFSVGPLAKPCHGRSREGSCTTTGVWRPGTGLLSTWTLRPGNAGWLRQYVPGEARGPLGENNRYMWDRGVSSGQ